MGLYIISTITEFILQPAEIPYFTPAFKKSAMKFQRIIFYIRTIRIHSIRELVIGYEIKKNSFVRLDVFDIIGKEVAIMVNEKQSAGKYEVDYMGKFSPSGIYFYRLMADGKIIDTKKMLLIK